MMKPYTSGEWRLNAGNETEIMADKRNVARAHCGGMSGVGLIEAQANARLIAAAPDLLAALEALEAVLRMSDRDIEVFDVALAAIAKAKGSNP